MLEVEVYNVENRNRLNVDRSNKLRNVVVREERNFRLKRKFIRLNKYKEKVYRISMDTKL